MAEHDFLPILEKQQFDEALDYIAERAACLVRAVLEQELPLDTLTIFTHSPEEHDFVSGVARRYGPESAFTHGDTLYISSDFTVQGHHIIFLGVRRPDATRPEVGYADYPVEDYEAILAANYPGAHQITSGRGQNLIELRHPDFDIRGYIVPAAEHNDGRAPQA
jgi:hypothetical protein